MSEESFLDRLQAVARERQQAEQAARRELEERVARLERERAFAFRRYNLLVEMTQAATGKTEREDSISAQVTAALLMVGWISREIDDLEDLRRPVADRLGRVAEAIFGAMNPPEGEGDRAEAASGDPHGKAIDAMTEFEGWYRITYGAEFLASLETYVEERPAVDF